MWCEVKWCDVIWCDVMWREAEEIVEVETKMTSSHRHIVEWCNTTWLDLTWHDLTLQNMSSYERQAVLYRLLLSWCEFFSTLPYPALPCPALYPSPPFSNPFAAPSALIPSADYLYCIHLGSRVLDSCKALEQTIYCHICRSVGQSVGQSFSSTLIICLQYAWHACPWLCSNIFLFCH